MQLHLSGRTDASRLIQNSPFACTAGRATTWASGHSYLEGGQLYCHLSQAAELLWDVQSCTPCQVSVLSLHLLKLGSLPLRNLRQLADDQALLLQASKLG